MAEAEHAFGVLFEGRFKATVEQVPRIRHQAIRAIESCSPVTEVAADTVALLVTEAATNSITHSGSSAVGLLIEWQEPGTLRVTVTDEGGTADMPHVARRGTVDDERGRGMALIDGCSQRWGVTMEADRSVSVWFEVTADSEPGAAALAASCSSPASICDLNSVPLAVASGGEGG